MNGKRLTQIHERQNSNCKMNRWEDIQYEPKWNNIKEGKFCVEYEYV